MRDCLREWSTIEISFGMRLLCACHLGVGMGLVVIWEAKYLDFQVQYIKIQDEADFLHETATKIVIQAM